MTSVGLKPVTIWLLAECFNQLCYTWLMDNVLNCESYNQVNKLFCHNMLKV
jgi:hypothetical protein